MAMGKFSPGVGGAPDEYFRSNTATRFDRGLLVKGQRVAIQPSGGIPGSFRIELIGWRTLIEDQEAFNDILNTLAWKVTFLAGQLVRNTAQLNVPKDTWATFNSMWGDPVMMSDSDSFIAEIGPTTFYAPFLEFGTYKMAPRPFLWPAHDNHQIDFVNGLIDAVAIAIGETGKVGRFSDELSTTIAQARKRLYSRQKALGDVMALGIGRQALRPVRVSMLRTARGLGDLNAILGNTIGGRFSRRISGRLTGRGLGITRTISATHTYSGTFPGGTAGSRVYSRVVGRQTVGIAQSGGGLF